MTIPTTLIAALSGEAVVERSTEQCLLPKGAACLCPEESTYRLMGNDGTEALFAVVRFALYRLEASGDIMTAVPSNELLGKSPSPVIDADGKFEPLCRTMHRNWTSEDALTRWRAHGNLLELLCEWIAARDAERGISSARLAVERAKAYLDEHLHENLTVPSLARTVELSPKYFSELFKKTYGVTVSDYLTDLRMKRAKQLLLQPDRLQKDVAHAVGYDDEFYFSRKFKRHYGLSPTAYVKKRKQKLALYGSTSLLGYVLPLGALPYAAPLHPKWSSLYYHSVGPDIPIHLDAYRQNQYRERNLRLLAESRPELIVCRADLETWELERLSAIGPVLQLPGNDRGWREQLRVLGDRLEERDEAERWISEFETKAADVRRELEDAFSSTSVMTVRLLGYRFFAHCNQGIFDVLHEELRVRSAYGTLEGPFDWMIDIEDMDALDPDRIFLLIRQETETLEYWQRLKQSPSWLSRRFVRADRIRTIASEPWREYSPIALERMLQESKSLFTGKNPSSIR
ncbi:AraC family transcriptional regulator [Paenibacillus sp. TRM 82003]|nr:AraC family transcriptional regulator [Paenibacillus sp. TRM 82003]